MHTTCPTAVTNYILDTTDNTGTHIVDFMWSILTPAQQAELVARAVTMGRACVEANLFELYRPGSLTVTFTEGNWEIDLVALNGNGVAHGGPNLACVCGDLTALLAPAGN